MPKRRFPILSIFEDVDVGVSILYPRRILFVPVARLYPAWNHMSVLFEAPERDCHAESPIRVEFEIDDPAL